MSTPTIEPARPGRSLRVSPWLAVVPLLLGPALVGGCDRFRLPGRAAGEPSAAVQADASRSAVAAPAALREFEGAFTVDRTAWPGRWEGEAFPDLALEVKGDHLTGAFSGNGRLEGDLHGDGLDFRFWYGADEYHKADLGRRGIGSGRLDAERQTVKGTYTTDLGDEKRWAMKRRGG